MKTYGALAVIQIILLGFQGISYLLIQRFQGTYHDMSKKTDYNIPLRSRWIYVYVLWYPLIALYPIYLYSCSVMYYKIYMCAILVDILISLLIYVLYPTSFQRPVPSGSNLSSKLLRGMYIVNYKGLNCMPSMHCSQCFIILITTAVCNSQGYMNILIAGGILLLSAGIVLSTLYIKQHVLADVITALPVAAFCYFISCVLI